MNLKLFFGDYFKRFKSVARKHLLTDLVLVVAALYASLLLRVGFVEIPDHIHTMNRFLPLFVALRLLTFIGSGVYMSMWRYVSVYDAGRLARAIALSTLMLLAVSYFLPDWGRVPRSVFFIDFVVVTFLLMGVRLARRMLFEAESSAQKRTIPTNRALIFGAGANGKALGQRISMDHNLDLDLIGFIDDGAEKQGRVISGIKVLGTKNDLVSIIEKEKINQVIIAITNAPGDLIGEIFSLTRPLGIRPQIVQNFFSRGSLSKNIDLYREVRLKDLLNRKVADINNKAIAEQVKDRVVLVTGAGGSIGSEIARQILPFEPRKLLLLDHSEFNLYEIDKELNEASRFGDRIHPLLVDMKDQNSIENVFKTHSPKLIFHAAAYKHVHLVESNPHPSILNNVLGTRNLLEHSFKFNAEGFVLVSSDKAVNPGGVMGATKRVCELMTTAYGHFSNGSYCSVRFGNVLGSSGSLIPLFKKQIMEGGPLTITHKDMKRFFMLINEAVSLVIMAAVISKPGDINVLKMGDAIKILDIAKSLLTLMGKSESEIPIVFTGVRPGEKMYEELYLKGDELKTDHPDILTLPHGDGGFVKNKSEYHKMFRLVEELLAMSKRGEDKVTELLKEIVAGDWKKAEQLPPVDTFEGTRWQH